MRSLDPFAAGQEGRHTYRIPALIATPKGTVLAFCEGRKSGPSDAGEIGLVMRRSLDGGDTWEPMQVVWEDGRNTVGNPCAAVERARMTVRRSDDEGVRWPASQVLWEGPAAYSCLAVMPDGTVGRLYERGETHFREAITLARFSLDWLAGG